MPNTMLQMLFRGSNAVGYNNYPDNVLKEFIDESSRQGIDVFRIFDSLNWLPQMEKSIQYVRDAGKLAETSICYTGDIKDPMRSKYDLNYYVEMTRELEKMGTHIIGIKDMAGLLKPQAAYELISTLKEVTDLPIHLHTHDTSGNGIITYSAASKAGVDIVDVASSGMSGATSQPSMSSLYYALLHGDRQADIDIENVQKINHYWEDVRSYYFAFENGVSAPQTEVYQHEMPGGQYTNLKQQAKAVGLEHKWDDVKTMYATVNKMFGDIVKVTPSSKVVGDMALFMVQNNLTEEEIYENGDQISFPDSVISFFSGDLGQPTGGFPKRLQKIILKGKTPIDVRPGLIADPVDFEKVKTELKNLIGYEPRHDEVLSYIMYPQVFLDFAKTYDSFGDVELLDTPTFFYGMRLNETVEVQIERGKTLIIHLDDIGEPNLEGNRILFFTLNGQRREIVVKDRSIKSTIRVNEKADLLNKEHVAATMSGSVLKLLVKNGDKVEKGTPLLVTEAMKMETTIQSTVDGVVRKIHVVDGDSIESGDLLLEVQV